MKKFITLLAVFLIGTASVFAQWDCDVTWSYPPEADCQPEHLPQQHTYIIKITLYIYDVANGNEQVTVPNPVNTEVITELETNFTEAQCQVKDYCDDDPPNAPSFTVTALVEFVNTVTLQTFCDATGYTSGLSCDDFYNGDADVDVVFD